MGNQSIGLNSYTVKLDKSRRNTQRLFKVSTLFWLAVDVALVANHTPINSYASVVVSFALIVLALLVSWVTIVHAIFFPSGMGGFWGLTTRIHVAVLIVLFVLSLCSSTISQWFVETVLGANLSY